MVYYLKQNREPTLLVPSRLCDNSKSGPSPLGVGTCFRNNSQQHRKPSDVDDAVDDIDRQCLWECFCCSCHFLSVQLHELGGIVQIVEVVGQPKMVDKCWVRRIRWVSGNGQRNRTRTRVDAQFACQIW